MYTYMVILNIPILYAHIKQTKLILLYKLSRNFKNSLTFLFIIIFKNTLRDKLSKFCESINTRILIKKRITIA